MIVALAVLVVPGLGRHAADAGEEAVRPAAGGITLQADPCGFFRSQAFGRGLGHYATEMQWACEAIQSRRAAEMSLSERLLAVELALDRYRASVVEAGRATFVQNREREAGYFGAGEATKAALAESTGMLAALEAIRSGF